MSTKEGFHGINFGLKITLFVGFCCVVGPLPFLVIGLTTLATGNNYLILSADEGEKDGHEG